ncbi:unnamed protein product [marine sediment metagenome]|uniref:Uncharacterized protein n=1 Tax=marine sediment metagenome TaxID=412755 RepID=X0UP46_9ZZZZ
MLAQILKNTYSRVNNKKLKYKYFDTEIYIFEYIVKKNKGVDSKWTLSLKTQ